MELKGELCAYWEQGWEGRIEFALQPEDFDRPVFLEDSDQLTIFGNEGEALWSGEIHFVRRRFWDNHKLDAGVWNYQKQKGVSYNQWMQWFWARPPLKAILIRK